VEAAEGTDAMLARIASLPDNIRGTPGNRRGVLVKARKPTQDGKTDLPVIGVQTVHNAATASLAGIAVDSAALIVNRKAVIAAADKAGLFVLGFAPSNATG
jgi:UDP-2,3-diacylglucosamine hydrolase